MKRIITGTQYIKEGVLDSFDELERRVIDLETSEEIKDEILKYIEMDSERVRKHPTTAPGLLYKMNLQYIIDNIEKDGLLDELRKFNRINH